jgi:hypothetical protein
MGLGPGGKTPVRVAGVRARIAELLAGPEAALAAQQRDCGNPACAALANATRSLCASCGQRYCGRACQAAHWKQHKAVCVALKCEGARLGLERRVAADAAAAAGPPQPPHGWQPGGAGDADDLGGDGGDGGGEPGGQTCVEL